VTGGAHHAQEFGEKRSVSETFFEKKSKEPGKNPIFIMSIRKFGKKVHLRGGCGPVARLSTEEGGGSYLEKKRFRR